MGLEFIKSFESSTDTSSKNVTDMFIAPYDKFLVVIKEMQTSVSGRYGEFRFIDNTDTVKTDANYDWIFRQQPSYTDFFDRPDTNATEGRGLVVDPQTLAESGGVQCYVLNPLDSGKYTSIIFKGSYTNTGGGYESLNGICTYTTKNVITGMSFFFSSSSNIDGLKLSVYGVKS